MSARSRVATLAITHARELLRRRLALGLLFVLPAVMYLSVLAEESSIPPGENPFTLRVGVIGVAWALAGAGFFLALSTRRVDERLILAGYQRTELAAGRLAFLGCVAVPVVITYSLLITMLSRGHNPTVILAIITTAIIAVMLGLALAAILPRELEGALALIAIIGVQTSLPADSPAVVALPFYGPTQLIVIAWNSTGSLVPPLLHATATTTLLLILVFALWRRGLTVTHNQPIAPPTAC